MTDRTTTVTLAAQVNGYIANMERAEAQTRKMGNSAASAAEKLEKQHTAMREVGVAVTAFGVVAAAGLAIAVKKFADFDQAMSNVKAATQESTANMELLRAAALEAGASTVFTATEAANALEELGKAGLSTQQILDGGLDGALSLAAAGQLGVAEAAGVAAVAVKQFNLEGADVPHVADLLAAGAGKAVGDVQDLSMALKQAGLVANGAGQSIEDTTGVLSAFADAGLLGSDAGTSLKAAIIALQAPTDKSRRIMEQYGLSFYDSNGEMLTFTDIAGQLQGKLSGLTAEQRNAALAQIFGNDALRVANILYNQGADGIQKYIDQTNDSGYAAKVAADRLDNLAGDVEKLGGAFDTALIKSGSGANDVLRTLVQGATGLVDAIGSLPEPVLGAGLAVGGLVTVVALAGGTALLAVPKIAQFKLALATLNVSAGSVATSVGAFSGALAVAGLALSVFAAEQAAARAKAQAYAAALDQGSDALRDIAKENLATARSFLWLEQDSAFDAAQKLGIGLDLVTDASLGNVSAMKQLRDELEAAKDGSFDTANAIVTVEEAVKGENASLERAIEVNKQKNEATEEGVDVTKSAADAYIEAAEGVEDLNSQLRTMIDTINEANGVGQDAISANIDYADALAAVDQAIADGQANWDQNTIAGRANKDMLVGLAQDAQKAADAQFALDNNTDAYRATLESSRQALIDRAQGLGATADEAQALADQIFRIPSETEWKLIADTAQATTQIGQFIANTEAKVIKIGVTTYRKDPNGEISFSNGPGTNIGRAAGGILPGPPSSKDNMLIHAASGEFVVNAASTQRNRGLLEYINSGGSVRGYANGGMVQPRYASSAPGGALGFSGPVVGELHVHALPGMDAHDIANEAVRIVERRLK